MRMPATPDPRQFLGRKVGDDTIVHALHLGGGAFRFELRSPDGERTVYEVAP